jgi:hypothetical protein
MDPTQAPQQALDPAALQKFMQLMQAKGGPAAPSAPSAPNQQTPGRVGQTPNVMTPPNIVWDPKTAIGNPGPPAAQQQTGTPTYRPDEGMSQAMMAHLDPKGAATFSAIQGIGSFLGQIAEKKQKNQAAEATNLAQSLMTAIDNKDISGMTAIMGDPKKMKLIDKVYKGWLQKAEDAAQPQEQKPVDSDMAAFEKGIADYTGKKVDAQQQQGGQQQQRPPMQQNNPQGTPQSIGGYRVPQAGPAQMMKNMQESAQAQYAKQNPESAIEGPMTPERIARMEKLQADVETAQSKAMEAQGKLQTADQQTKTALVRYQTVMQQGQNLSQKAGFDIQKTQLEVSKAREEVQKSLVMKDIATIDKQTHIETLMNTIAKGQNQKDKAEKEKKAKGLPLKEQERLYSLDKADKLLDVMQKNDSVSSSDVADLQAVFAAAGANTLSKALPGLYRQSAPSWAGGSDGDTVTGIRSAVKAFRSGIEEAADKNYPGWRDKDAKSVDTKKDEPAPKAGAPSEAESEDEGDTVEIDLTAN